MRQLAVSRSTLSQTAKSDLRTSHFFSFLLRHVAVAKYWPNELNAPTVYGSVEVRLIREEHVGYLAVRSFQLPDGHIVRQFQMKSWSPGAILPRDAQQLVDLLARVDKWLVESSSSSKLVVQCL